MAVKLSGSVCRKVPIKGVEFSSQSFGASLEVEINSADAVEVQTQLAQLYSSLNAGIDAQIVAASQPAVARSLPTLPPQTRNGVSSTNRIVSAINGNGRRDAHATEAQCRAVYAIAKAQCLEVAEILRDYNVGAIKDLTVKEASTIIDALKSRPSAK